jgi:hypothetical protein
MLSVALIVWAMAQGEYMFPDMAYAAAKKTIKPFIILLVSMKINIP